MLTWLIRKPAALYIANSLRFLFSLLLQWETVRSLCLRKYNSRCCSIMLYWEIWTAYLLAIEQYVYVIPFWELLLLQAPKQYDVLTAFFQTQHIGMLQPTPYSFDKVTYEKLTTGQDELHSLKLNSTKYRFIEMFLNITAYIFALPMLQQDAAARFQSSWRAHI